jgi:pyroglutamyl-peptidase
MNIIVTAFDSKKEDYQNNHSGIELLGRLPKQIGQVEIISIALPMIFDRCFDLIKEVINDDTLAVISLGTIAVDAIILERIAVNFKNAFGSDMSGYSPTDEHIIDNGPAAYYATIPISNIKKRLSDNNIPNRISYCAGVALCNNVLYHTAEYCQRNGNQFVYGFIHVPQMTHKLNIHTVTMDISKIEKALHEVLGELIEYSGN